jgi:uncharacterized coiled-coil DUF342 family protein
MNSGSPKSVFVVIEEKGGSFIIKSAHSEKHLANEAARQWEKILNVKHFVEEYNSEVQRYRNLYNETMEKVDSLLERLIKVREENQRLHEEIHLMQSIK